MSTEDYLNLFFPFDKLDVVKRSVESLWNIEGDNMMMALAMIMSDRPMAVNMSFQRQYSESYEWMKQLFTDSVRERGRVKYIPGGNPQPSNGKTIGHIIDHKFVPVADKPKSKVLMLSYGTARLIHDVSSDIMEDLLTIFPVKTATTIMAAAAIKIEKPAIKMSRYGSRYESSFISLYYPDASLSESSLSKLMKALGKDVSSRRLFSEKRISRLKGNTQILIDSTLKENNSIVNDLSHFSYKSKVRSTKDISLIYAYDFDRHEPICCEVMPGNHVDSAAYRKFIMDNHITRGIITDDKGFPIKKIHDIIEENKELHFLTPLKRNDTRIKDNNMLEFEQVLQNIDKDVYAKKVKIKGGHYLYSFKDNYKSFNEERTFINKAKKDKNLDTQKYEDKKLKFGTIVYESDMDMTCEEAYKCYSSRWEIELLFKAYKNDLQLKSTNLHSDESVMGMEFVNLISSLITKRIINKFSEYNLLSSDTYGDLIEDLSQAWREIKTTDIDMYNYDPKASDSKWIHTNIKTLDMIKKLGLCR